jgi:hypothetical protein
MCYASKEPMHMGEWKRKTQIYMLVVSLIMSLLGLAVMRSGRVEKDTGSMTTSQKLDALQKTEGQSPEMSRFLNHAKASQDANDEAAGAMPK